MSELVRMDDSELLLASPEARLSLLRKHLGDSLESVRAAARVLSAMEQAGDDLGQVPAHMVRMLKRINANDLLPEVVVRLSGRLRQKVALLPLSEQARMVQPGTSVLVATEEGAIEVEAQRLDPRQIDIVFGDGFVRSPDEQRALVRKQSQPSRRGRPPVEVEIDHQRGGVTYMGRFISRDLIVAWAAELSGREAPLERGGFYVAFGETKTAHQWAKDPRCKIGYLSLRNRLEKGWDVERAISEGPTPRAERRMVTPP